MVEQGIYFMNNLLFDENAFATAWRFNSPDCKLTDPEKAKLVFLYPWQACVLWEEEISRDHSHLMNIPSDTITVLHKTVLDFDLPESGEQFFHTQLGLISTVIFFWGPQCACLVPVPILIKAWTDFFYPSDENSIVCAFNKPEKIFSFENTFFSVIRG